MDTTEEEIEQLGNALIKIDQEIKNMK